MTDIRPTILVCDDDRLVLATLSHGLKNAGFDVVEADNGDDAILLARERRPDLALLDMRMNGKTGLDVAAYLRDHVGTPFMFLSAFNDERIVRQAVEFGALAYLVKPLDVRQIVPAVRAALARATARAAGADTQVAGEPATGAAPADEASGAWPVPQARPALPAESATSGTSAASAGPGSEAFGVAVDLIGRARAQEPDPVIEAMAVGVLMERHRLSAAAARRHLGIIAIDRGCTESAAAAEILTAATLLSGPVSPRG
jgi:DNA-binding response OmpR family regulator